MWITAELGQLRLMKGEGLGSGDKDQLKESKYKFGRVVRDAKQLHYEKLFQVFRNQLALCLEGPSTN